MSQKVSILIPTYNSSKYIEECLYSVVNQDYENLEIIVVDNESTDNTVELIKKFSNQHPNFIIDSAPNIYKNSSKEPIEKAYEIMTGEYFTIIDSDDFIKSDYVSNNMRFINNSSEKIHALQSIIFGVNEHGGALQFKNHEYLNMAELKNRLLQYCCVNSPTMFYHKDLLEGEILIEKPDLYSGACDYDKFCRIVDNDYFIHTSNQWFGHYYRWHSGQDSVAVLNDSENYDLKIQNFWRQKWVK